MRDEDSGLPTCIAEIPAQEGELVRMFLPRPYVKMVENIDGEYLGVTIGGNLCSFWFLKPTFLMTRLLQSVQWIRSASLSRRRETARVVGLNETYSVLRAIQDQ